MKEFSSIDIGAVIILTVYEDEAQTIAKDISTATSVAYVIKRPDETVVERVAAKNTTGVDGKVKYTLVAADLVGLEGLHDVQVSLGGTPWSGQSSSYPFLVRETHIAS